MVAGLCQSILTEKMQGTPTELLACSFVMHHSVHALQLDVAIVVRAGGAAVLMAMAPSLNLLLGA